MREHVKIPGFVDAVEGDMWWARLYTDAGECEAEMLDPLPEGMGPGNLFTIHRTKRGQTYLYWITKPRRTRNDMKRARQLARELRVLLSTLTD